MGFASKWNLLGCPQDNQLGKKSSLNLQGWSWQAAWYQKLRDTLIPWSKCKQGKDKKSNMNAYGRKDHERKRLYTNACGKERESRPQMPVAKEKKTKQQTKNGCPNQASKQLTPNERNKQLKPPQIPKQLPTCKHTVEKENKIKSQQSNRLLSATKKWTTTAIRAQSKNNCANDKQMESQTNHN